MPNAPQIAYKSLTGTKGTHVPIVLGYPFLFVLNDTIVTGRGRIIYFQEPDSVTAVAAKTQTETNETVFPKVHQSFESSR